MRPLFILTLITVFSCTSKNIDDKSIQTDTTQVVDTIISTDVKEIKEAKSASDTAVIFDMDTNPVIFIWPDSIEIAQLKQDLGNDFYTVADDQNYYLSTASDFLESRSVGYEFTTKRYIKLKLNYSWNHADHPISEMLIDTDTLKYKWIAILNDGYDTPIVSAYIDIPMNFE